MAIEGADNKRLATASSQGTINHREYMKARKTFGFTGPICIEAPRPGDREWYAAEDLRCIKAVFADIAV